MTGYFTTLPSVCYCTTWGKLNRQNMRWNEQKYVKKHPQHYRLKLEEGLIGFNNFWCKHFWHSCPSNDCSSSHLTQCLLLHYLGKPKQATCTMKWTKTLNKFHIFRPVSPNSKSITLFDCHAAACLPDDFQECWWIQKVIGEVWIVL